MKIKITRIDKALPLPEYKTEGAVAFDIYAREDTVVPPQGTVVVPTNLVIGTPEGYLTLFASRSSSFKRGCTMANGMGILDPDFCGPDDEVKLPILNYTDTPVTISRGERFAQAMVIPVMKAEWEEVEIIKEASRGGLGSTGDF